MFIEHELLATGFMDSLCSWFGHEHMLKHSEFQNECCVMVFNFQIITGSTTTRRAIKFMPVLMFWRLSERLWRPGHHGSTSISIQAKLEFSFEVQHLLISGWVLFTIPEARITISLFLLLLISADEGEFGILSRGGQWNSGGHCKEATQPLNETFNFDYPEKSIIAEEVIKQMKTPVTFLNITSLSQYRIDGHPSIFGRKPEKAYSSSIQDCSHWCLPGVPDTWNELLYFHLQSTRKKRFRE